MDQEYVALSQVRSRVSAVWLIGSGAIFLLLAVQCMLGKYEDKGQQVWGWVLPMIAPNFSLIFTVIRMDALRKGKAQSVRKTFYTVALSLSVAYLVSILLTILIEPYTPYDALQLFELSNFWLGPFQGVVSSSLGVLYFSKRNVS